MKNILITGATSGIGRSTANLLAANGYKLFLTGRNLSRFDDLPELTRSNSVLHACDVRNYEEVQKAIKTMKDQMGSIDVVINNAGLGFFDQVITGSIEQWHEMVDTNVKGVLNVLHASLPSLIESCGHIINIGSVASHQVFPNSGIYCATKHAVFAISESIRLELSDKVRVTTISPGSVNTPFIEKTTNEKMLGEYRNYFAQGLTPESVAGSILFAIESSKNAVISEVILRPNRAVK